MNRVAIIPARGGSKRIPRKNIKTFHGHPIISYPIRAALASQLFERVYVSTDDEEIAKVALAYGASFIGRPAELADDHTGTQPVVRHALGWIHERTLDPRAPEYACCIYPTAALLTPTDLRIGLEALQAEPRKAYAYSVARYHPAPQRALRLDQDRTVRAVYQQFDAVRTQDLEPRYFDAGQYYWGRAAAFANNVPLRGEAGIGVEIDGRRVVDIDEPEDWALAEAIYAHHHPKHPEPV